MLVSGDGLFRPPRLVGLQGSPQDTDSGCSMSSDRGEEEGRYEALGPRRQAAFLPPLHTARAQATFDHQESRWVVPSASSSYDASSSVSSTAPSSAYSTISSSNRFLVTSGASSVYSSTDSTTFPISDRVLYSSPSSSFLPAGAWEGAMVPATLAKAATFPRQSREGVGDYSSPLVVLRSPEGLHQATLQVHHHPSTYTTIP